MHFVLFRSQSSSIDQRIVACLPPSPLYSAVRVASAGFIEVDISNEALAQYVMSDILVRLISVDHLSQASCVSLYSPVCN